MINWRNSRRSPDNSRSLAFYKLGCQCELFFLDLHIASQIPKLVASPGITKWPENVSKTRKFFEVCHVERHVSAAFSTNQKKEDCDTPKYFRNHMANDIFIEPDTTTRIIVLFLM